jgi:hypothetical protein
MLCLRDAFLSYAKTPLYAFPLSFLQGVASTSEHFGRHLNRPTRRLPVLLLNRIPDEGIHRAFEPIARIRSEDDVLELRAAG